MTSEFVSGHERSVDAKTNKNTERSRDSVRQAPHPQAFGALDNNCQRVQLAFIVCTKHLTFGLLPKAAAAALRQSYTKNLTFHSSVQSQF
ncbi:hypothetical protein [Burkholderia ambifaria]|uniref:hypothetical protein n=1 Tax=Burkholderia ambifaria TaxID=152480 RepID=UPI001589B123|nr:hypothetical protein [Burkholderia ambifaria]